MQKIIARYPAVVAGFGAMLCITALASVQHFGIATALLMAPFGATMVILFGLPDSPLAQPKNIFFGHVLTTAVGLGVYHTIGVEPWSLGLAVGLSVALMLLTNTTHPPAGANPLLVMLTGQSWGFIVAPVALGAALIIVFGLVYHRYLCRRSYPKQWW